MKKSIDQIGKLLADTYSKAPKKEKVTAIIVFSIKHSEDIQRLGIKEILQNAKLPIGYRPEVSKAIRLSKYVTVK